MARWSFELRDSDFGFSSFGVPWPLSTTIRVVLENVSILCIQMVFDR